MNILITLKDVGRNKVNKCFGLHPNDKELDLALKSCEVEALRQVEKYLVSSIVRLIPKEKDYSNKNTYDVCVGDFLRVVGLVEIEVKQ